MNTYHNSKVEMDEKYIKIYDNDDFILICITNSLFTTQP